MDLKVELVEEFYRGLPKDRAKVETYEHGFAFLDGLLSDGTIIEYGEMSGLLHKYKLANIPGAKMEMLLSAHVAKRYNVCLYFDGRENSLFCYNLDNNYKTNNTEIIPEMSCAVLALHDLLSSLGCEPLVVASGRGYHIWSRLSGAVENDTLYNFMLRSMARVLLGIHEKGLDHKKIKANFYPDPRARDVVSLRLFGSEHAKNKVFSHVLAKEGLLDEAASWDAFANHLRCKTVSVSDFARSCETLAAMF